MSSQAKWDAQYQEARQLGSVSEVLLEHRRWLPGSGKALDLACGISGNGLFFSGLGLQTEVWDISQAALQLQLATAASRRLSIIALQRDCELNPPEPDSFDVICVSHFLFRPLCRHLADALRPGGQLFYQTFVVNPQRRGGPRNPDFLLLPGELPDLFSDLQRRYYQESASGKAFYVGRKKPA